MCSFNENTEILKMHSFVFSHLEDLSHGLDCAFSPDVLLIIGYRFWFTNYHKENRFRLQIISSQRINAHMKQMDSKRRESFCRQVRITSRFSKFRSFFVHVSPTDMFFSSTAISYPYMHLPIQNFSFLSLNDKVLRIVRNYC